MQGVYNTNMQEAVAFNYNTTLCINRIITQGSHRKGVQISYNHFLRLPAKYNYSASASPWPHFVFCL